MPFGPSDDGDEVVDDVGIRGAREAGGQDGPGQNLAGLGIRDCQAPGEQVAHLDESPDRRVHYTPCSIGTGDEQNSPNRSSVSSTTVKRSAAGEDTVLATPPPRTPETAMTRRPTDSTFDAIVLGAGPAGEVAAGRLAEGGLRVALVERDLIGGECSYWGCIPSKTLIRPGDVLAAARRVPGAASAVTGAVDAA